jgi:hypothetical protein
LVDLALSVPICAGMVLSFVALRRARASGGGYPWAVMALILNLVPVFVGILAAAMQMMASWPHVFGSAR